MDLKMEIKPWLPVLMWCGVIFIFSSIPTLPEVGFIWWDFALKKSAHMIEYAILFFLFYRAMKKTFIHLSQKRFFIVSLLFCILYAVLDEFHQSFIRGRTSTVRDVGFDILGMLIAYYMINKKKIFKVADE